MPTYDYTCDQCGHAFETFQSMKDDPLRKCPACGKRSLRRLIGTGAGLIFKGSGFYETDYRKSQTDSTDSGATEKKEAPAKTETTTTTSTKDAGTAAKPTAPTN